MGVIKIISQTKSVNTLIFIIELFKYRQKKKNPYQILITYKFYGNQL